MSLGNIVVWRGQCARCRAPADSGTMDLYVDLADESRPKLELICKNVLACAERKAAHG